MEPSSPLTGPSRNSRSRGRVRRRMYFEALESRQLLTTTFIPGDLAGSWTAIGMMSSAGITVDAGGNVTAAACRDFKDDTHPAVIAGASLTLLPSGAMSCNVDWASAGSWELAGQMDMHKDLIATSDWNYAVDVPVLIKHSAANFSNKDLAGTWALSAFMPASYTAIGGTSQGTVTTDGNGNVTGGALTSDDGYRVRLSSGSYSVQSDGTFTLTVMANGVSYAFAGAVNDSRDFAGANAVSFAAALSSDNGGPTALFLEKLPTTATYSNAYLNGTYWTTVVDVFGDIDLGTFSFDGRGHINAAQSDFAQGVSGTYAISSTGLVTINAKVSYATDSLTLKLTGALTTSGTLLALTGSMRDAVYGERFAGLATIVPDNRAPTLTSVKPLDCTAIAGQPMTLTWGDLAAAADECDVDGDDVCFAVMSSAAAAGELDLNGTPVTSFPAYVHAGDTLCWTPAAGTRGSIAAFNIQAFDGVAMSARDVPVKINTVLPPTISIAATGKPAETTNGTTTGVGHFVFTRVNGDLNAELDVFYTVTGTATVAGAPGADHDLLASGMVVFAPHKTTATVNLVPVDDFLIEPGEFVQVTLATNPLYLNKPGKDSAKLIILDHNRPITIGTMSALPGTTANTDDPLSTDNLIASAGLVDPEGAAVSFKVKALTKGTLYVNGAKAKAGTVIHAGDTLSWTPPKDTTGALAAFSLTASDGVNTTRVLKFTIDVT